METNNIENDSPNNDGLQILTSTKTDETIVASEIAASGNSITEKNTSWFRNKWLWIFTASGGVLVMTGALLWYFLIFHSPERILQRMFENQIDVTSLEYSGDISIEVEQDSVDSHDNQSWIPKTMEKGTGPKNLTIQFTGKTDLQQADKPKGLFAITLTGNIFSLGNSELGFETRLIDGVYYVRLTHLPDEASAGAFINLKDKWISIDLEAIKKMTGGQDSEEEIGRSRALTDQQKKAVKIILKKAKIFQVTKKLPSESLDGIKAYHYQFKVNEEEFKKFMGEYIEILDGKPAEGKEMKKIEESLSAIDFTEGEVWIGQKDLLPYKISTQITYTAAKTPPAKAQVTILSKGFNTPVKIEVPSPTRTIEEAMRDIQTQHVGSVSTLSNPYNLENQDAKKDSDNDELPDSIEKTFGTNPNNPDSDGDGYPDGREIIRGFDPLDPKK